MKIFIDGQLLREQMLEVKQEQQIMFFQLLRTEGIIKLAFFFIVLRTVQFDDQSCTMTVKIYNIIVDHLLTQTAHRIVLQKVIP